MMNVSNVCTGLRRLLRSPYGLAPKPPQWKKSVTYVPGLNCYLCSRTFSIGNAGRNIRIGIIDSGINPAHPMFDDSGLSAPICFDCGDLAFTNNKVIVARNYVLPIYGLNPEPDTPEDKLGHGSQVAAIAAGRRVSAPLAQIQGIAPLAFLGNYRVFGTRGINSTTTSAAVIAAVNDAVADGMNVLNLSLGGDAMDPATDPEQITIANATAMGVVVVIAGGNSGPGLGTITSPGTSPAAITVGASSNERIFAGALEIDAVSVPPGLEQIPYAPGEDVTIDSATVPAPIVYSTADGCNRAGLRRAARWNPHRKDRSPAARKLRVCGQGCQRFCCRRRRYGGLQQRGGTPSHHGNLQTNRRDL